MIPSCGYISIAKISELEKKKTILLLTHVSKCF